MTFKNITKFTFASLLFVSVFSCSSGDNNDGDPILSPKIINFLSGPDWKVYNKLGTLVGFAENVCLTASAPLNCPDNAIQFGTAGDGWNADLSAITGATWIWAPNITAQTPSASLAQYSFEKDFTISGSPESGSLYIAVDDYAEIFVNYIQVGTLGSDTDVSLAAAAQSNLKNFDISTFLVTGVNSIRIYVYNGPDSFAGTVNAGYSQNPAGVVFGGTLVRN